MAAEFQDKPLNSFNGRRGWDVRPAAGDYRADQVTNAVDQLQRYADPAWLASLTWAKLLSTPDTIAALAALATTAFGRGLLAQADAAAALAYIGGAQVPVWAKVATVSYTALQTAGLTNDLEVYSLPAKGVVHGAVLRVTTGFVGGLIATITGSLGVSGSLAKYAVAASIAAVATLPNVTNLFPVAESFAGATSVRLAVVAVGANLSALTAGSIDVYLCTSLLP